MDDDFNTPEAIAVLFELAREINKHKQQQPQTANLLAACLLRLGDILGLLQVDPEVYLRDVAPGKTGAAGTISSEAVEELIARRLQARTEKDWAEADRIRDELDAAGIILEDGASGTRWRRS